MYIVVRENKEVGGGILAQKGLLSHVCERMVRGIYVLVQFLLPACSVVDPDLHGSASFW